MKLYWNLALLGAALTGLLASFHPVYLLAPCAVLVGAWLGTRLKRYVPLLRTKRGRLVVAVFSGAAVAIAVGAALHIPALLLAGLTALLTPVFASMAHDIEWDS